MKIRQTELRQPTSWTVAITPCLPDFDPNRLAAIIYRPEDDMATLLADFASDLLLAGKRIGGVVHRNVK